MNTLSELAQEGREAWETMYIATHAGAGEVAFDANRKWLSILEEIKNGKYEE